jgi:hypothetical protein
MHRTRLKNLLESVALFLLLVPAFVVLHLEKVFHHQINYHFAAVQLCVMMLATVIIIIFCKAISRNKKKASITAFILMLGWFYIGPMKNAMEEVYPDKFYSSYTCLMPLSLITLFFLVYTVRKYSGSLNRLFFFINTLWLIFILVDIISIIISDILPTTQQIKNTYRLPVKNIEDSLKPDIYFIVFDSYSANAVLKKMGFDNHAIEKMLEASGFKMITGSTSNYNLTPYSLASTFNMKYLDFADTRNKILLNDYFKAVDAVKWNGLFPWLSRNGYQIEAYTFFDFPGNPSINKKHDVWDINGLFLQHNLALKVYDDIYWNFGLKSLNTEAKIAFEIEQRDAYDDTVFSKLLNSRHQHFSSPVFTYAHFFMPHSKNSYDSAGNKIIQQPLLSEKETEKLYTEEIKFVNKRILAITDTLLKHANRPLVIIIQGDHGYRFWDDERKPDEFPNFNAVYFSNGDYGRLPDTLSNVNLFKAVLNTWFKQQIPYDPNRHYFLKYK